MRISGIATLVASIAMLAVVQTSSAQWGYVESLPRGTANDMIKLSNGSLLIGTHGGVFASTDGGQTWFFTGIGVLAEPNAGNDMPLDVAEDDEGHVYVAIEDVYRGTLATLDDFAYYPLSGDPYGIEFIDYHDGTFILTSDLEIWRSTDHLETFDLVWEAPGIFNGFDGLYTDPATGTYVVQMDTDAANDFLVSSDDGLTWDEVNSDADGFFGTPMVFGENSRLYFTHDWQNQGYVRYSDDFGATSTILWDGDDNFNVDGFALGDGGNMAVLRGTGVLFSTDSGASWTFSSTPFTDRALAFAGETMIVLSDEGVYTTETGFNWIQWTEGIANLRLNDAEYTSEGIPVLLGSGFAWYKPNQFWTDFAIPNLSDTYYTVLTQVSSGRIFAMGRVNSGGAQVGHFREVDGTDWTAVSGLDALGNWNDMHNILEHEDTLYLGNDGGILQSQDDGASWSLLSSDVGGEFQISGDGTMFVFANGSLNISDDGGSSWTPYTDVFGIEGVAVSPTSDAAIIRGFSETHRLDGDGTLTSIQQNLAAPLGNDWLSAIQALGYDHDGTLYVAVTVQSSVYGTKRTALLESDDDGATFTLAIDGWHMIQFALVERFKRAADGQVLAITNMGLFATDVVASVGDGGLASSAERPGAFHLAQNYPNPFNPTTTIAWSMPIAGTASLTVYDMLGREVARLVDSRTLAPGVHQRVFDGSSLASGVYLVRLDAEGTVLSRRMTLMK